MRMPRASISKKKDTTYMNSKKTIHLSPVRHAKTFSSRFKGLMGVEKKEFNYALVFHLAEKGTMNASIHMLFMKMPVDGVWLDEDKRVVDMVQGLKPWTFNFTPHHPAKYIVEMPARWIREKKITRGTILSW